MLKLAETKISAMDSVASFRHTDVMVSNEKWGLRGSSSRVARYALENGALDYIDEDEFYSELALGPPQMVRLVSANDIVAFPSSMQYGNQAFKSDVAIVALSPVEVMSGSRNQDEVSWYCRALGIAGLQSADNGAALYNSVLEQIRESRNGFRSFKSKVHHLVEACPFGMDRKVLRVMQRLTKQGAPEDALVPLFLCYHTLAPGERIMVSRSERCAFVCGEAIVIHLNGATAHYPKQVHSFRPMSASTPLLDGWFRETVCYPGKRCVLEPLGARKTIIVVIEGEGAIGSSRQCHTGQCFFQSEKSIQISVPSFNRGYLKLIRVPIF